MANADDYAAARQNYWFTANNQTPADGNLTGQCVTLIKWFCNDLIPGFPNPFAARGNAKDVGRNLVAQGLATEVNWNERRRGDIVCMEYGQYGHIYVQLSGGRVFESNVNWSGVSSKIVDGDRVYASRIGSENEAWRVGKNSHVYRLKGYNEGDIMQPTTFNQLQQMSHAVLGRTTPVTKEWYDSNPPERSMTTDQVLDSWIPSEEAKNFRYKAWDYDRLAAEFEAYKKAHPISNDKCTPDERAYLDALKKITQ